MHRRPRLRLAEPAWTYLLVFATLGEAADVAPGRLVAGAMTAVLRRAVVVAVMADGEFTVKRFRRTGSGVVLESEHPDYPPIAIRDSESRIWGVVRTVIHHV